MKHKLESRLLGEISITSDVQMTPAESEEELNSLWMKVKEDCEKPDFQKMKIMAPCPTTS